MKEGVRSSYGILMDVFRLSRRFWCVGYVVPLVLLPGSFQTKYVGTGCSAYETHLNNEKPMVRVYGHASWEVALSIRSEWV